MKLLICGSRTIKDYSLLLEAMEESGYRPTALISGGSPGVDRLAERLAEETGTPIEVFYPEWAKYRGKRAGLVRNCQMVHACDAVLAVWDGLSRGTRFTVDYAVKKQKPVWVKEIS